MSNETTQSEAWACDNYLPPLTCLTAPSSETGRCDACKEPRHTHDADGIYANCPACGTVLNPEAGGER